MDAQILIKDDAIEFAKDYKRRHIIREGVDKFMSNLKSELYKYYESNDKSTFLYTVFDEMQKFYDDHLQVCKKVDNPLDCATNKFYLKSFFYVEQEIKSLNPKFEYKRIRRDLDSELISKNMVLLKDYPEVSIHYYRAIHKLKDEDQNRNLLDDLRLSLEVLLRKVLNNEKSLENQFAILGKYLKEKGSTAESTNLIRTIFDYYSKFQNENVKHDENLLREEVEFIINLTTSIMLMIITKSNK